MDSGARTALNGFQSDFTSLSTIEEDEEIASPVAGAQNGGLGALGRLPHNLMADLSGRLRWQDLVFLSFCSSDLRQRHGLWVRYRMNLAADTMTIIDALTGINTLPQGQRPLLLCDFSGRMSTVKGAGSPMVLEMWRQCFATSKTWLQCQTEDTFRDGTVNLLIAGCRVVAPKDRVKPEWVVCDALRYMSTLPLEGWPPVLTVLLNAGGHAEELAFYVEKFVRRFGGGLNRTSDALASAMAQAMILRVKTTNVSHTLKRRFGVSDVQRSRIADEIALAIGSAAANAAVTMNGAVSLDIACQRWRRAPSGTVRRLAEAHYIAAIGPDMRLDSAWQMLLLRSDAMSDNVRIVAEKRVVSIEADTMSALADDPTAVDEFLFHRESIGGIMSSQQWQFARQALDDLPWLAQPALMHRLASRIAPPWARAWFGDEVGLKMLSDVAVWTTDIVPRCLSQQHTGLAAHALAASLSLCSTFDDIDPSTGRALLREVFDCGLALLPPHKWGILLDTLCFASRGGKRRWMHAIGAGPLREAVRTFLCDPQSRFVSPTPRFAKWLCREVPAFWELLPDGPAPHQRWQAFCERFDLLPDMRQYLRRCVLAHYARGLEKRAEPVSDVLCRVGFTDSQGLPDIEDALWRIQAHWPAYTPVETRQAVFGLTTRLREKIENEGRGHTAIQIMATVTR